MFRGISRDEYAKETVANATAGLHEDENDIDLTEMPVKKANLGQGMTKHVAHRPIFAKTYAFSVHNFNSKKYITCTKISFLCYQHPNPSVLKTKNVLNTYKRFL